MVDKGLKEKDIAWGKFDTWSGPFFTVVVAVFIVIVTGTVLHGAGYRRRRPGLRRS